MAKKPAVPVQLKDLLAKADYKKRFSDILGEKAIPFTASLLNIVNNTPKLAECDPNSVISAAAVAATLDLPVDPNLGFGFIIPYRNKATFQATFQIGYKGFIQLAQRSGRYKSINVTHINEGEIKSFDRVKGKYTFDFTSSSDTVIGYAAYIELTTGFEKTIFMTNEELYAHAAQYSKSYQYAEKNGKDSKWHTNFGAMAMKTVLKKILTKYGPLSVSMEKAILSEDYDEPLGPIKEPLPLLPAESGGTDIIPYDIKGKKPENETAEDKWSAIKDIDSAGALKVLKAYEKEYPGAEVNFAWCISRYEQLGGKK